MTLSRYFIFITLTLLKHLHSSLPGPKEYTYNEAIDVVSSLTLKEHRAPSVPKPIAKAVAQLMNRLLWWQSISEDEVERRHLNDLAAIPEGHKSWNDLDIIPDYMEDVSIPYVRRYRTATTSNLPVERGGKPYKPPASQPQTNI